MKKQIMIGICIAIAAILLFVFLRPQEKKQAILNEIELLSNAPYQTIIYDSLTAQDFEKMQNLVAGDHEAEHYVEEAAWLADHHEAKHVGHSLAFLRAYTESGIDSPCTPHELTHIITYLKYDEYGLVEENIEHVGEHLAEWKGIAEKQYERFPQYYPHFDELMSSIDEVIPMLEQKEYGNETITLLNFIEENEVC